ncbi:MAG TPA: KaiC domain-containing protein [Sulfolobales archaeon]|nr:KaiC domain-containing protein [Sulfolobales archaeon]
MVTRISTGVHSLDAMLEGGVPEGFFIAIVGEPGTGKTVLSLHFIHQGIVDGDKCIYVTTEEDRESLLDQVRRFGWDWEPFIGKRLIIVDALKGQEDPWSIQDMDIELLINKVIEAKKTLGYGRARLVIDSISAFWLEKPAMARKYSYLVKRILGKWGFTAYLVSQYAITTMFAFGWGVEHIADGVIRFRRKISGGVLKRYLMIEKMRNTRHDKKIYEIDITDRGLVILNPADLDIEHVTSI